MRYYLLGITMLLPLWRPINVSADLPQAPVILDFGPGGCSPQAEICGDGIDQDCNGSDASCPAGPGGTDADMDGYYQGNDCDDLDRRIYPGLSVTCTTNSNAAGTKTCQSNGSYSTCTTTPLCEATGGGQCKYISKLTGNDSNPGTFAQPWKTLAPIFDYRCFPGGSEQNCPGDVAPANTYDLQPGDVVYLMSGLYNESFDFEGTRYSLHLWNVNGTSSNKVTIKAYPGASPVISPSQQAMGIYIFYSNHILIEGIEVTRAYQHGIRVANISNVEFRNMWVRDTDGVDNANTSGVRSNDAHDWSFHHSLIHDNYDRTNADTGGIKTENSRNVVLFGGGNVRFHHNVIFQTPATNASKTGACLVHKHGLTLPGGKFEVDHNIFKNCFFAAIGTCSYGGRFHHNLIVDSDEAISIRNHGGPANFYDNIAEYNTIVNTPGFLYEPKHAVDTGGIVGVNIFRNNIVVDDGPYNTDKGGIIRIDNYGNAATYNIINGSADLQINSNCYHNIAHTVQFSFFPNIPQGGMYDLTGWRTKGYDAQSLVGNAQLDTNNVPQNASCQGYGHLVGW